MDDGGPSDHGDPIDYGEPTEDAESIDVDESTEDAESTDVTEPTEDAESTDVTAPTEADGSTPRDGAPVDVLPGVEPGDVLECYFDWYHPAYPEKPDSPLRTTVTEITEKELVEGVDVLPGSLRSVHLTVPESDEKANRYWIEHREEHQGESIRRSVSQLLYEDATFSAMKTTGRVGNIDRIVVDPDENR